MSKKKNTLKDLDEFLKQQAASLVTPEPVNMPVQEPATVSPAKSEGEEPTADKIISQLSALAKQNPNHFRTILYDIIIKSLEQLPHSLPEDKMLINTSLYLKSGDQWKDVIRKYWKEYGS
ncbi:MAG TPA: hypothetical protein VD884_18585 [Ohtaekwangia sp.]|nr:hypothetical protein [Ohtaekwangia sp.]